MTTLEAISLILEEAGQGVATALDTGNSQSPEARAERTLEHQSRTIQAEWWNFNRNLEVTLTASGGEFSIPAGVISIDTTGGSASVPVSMRGDKLYNVRENSFTFTEETLEVEYSSYFEFDCVPEEIAQYIAYEAAVNYVERHIDPRSTRLPALRQRVAVARRKAKTFDSTNRDESIFDGPQGRRFRNLYGNYSGTFRSRYKID